MRLATVYSVYDEGAFDAGKQRCCDVWVRNEGVRAPTNAVRTHRLVHVVASSIIRRYSTSAR
jgi:hypothetical protein